MDQVKAIATRTCQCEICGCKVKRNKTFTAKIGCDLEKAKADLAGRCKAWELTEKQKHCSVCWSIIKAV